MSQPTSAHVCVQVIFAAAALGSLGYVVAFRKPKSKPAKKKFVRVPVANLPALQDDCILQAMLGKPTKRIPVWMMRQAGRYLPEFRALRVEHEFFEACQNPEIASRLTIQPLERFGPGLLSCCIFFSDILVIPQAMGMQVEMVPGKGPVFPQRLESAADISQLKLEPNVEATLGYVLDGLNLTRQQIGGRVPLLGFSGAPYTLMAYMIEGGGSKTLSRSKSALYGDAKNCHVLLQALTNWVVEYLVAQVEQGGAQGLQVFESNAGDMSPQLWEEFSLPYLKQIASRVRARGVTVPLIVFSRGSNWEGTLEALCETEYDTIGLDWTISPSEARSRVKGRKALQGNLDPSILFADPSTIRKQTYKMLHEFGSGQGLVCNLGHGMEPGMNPEHAKAFLQAVSDFSHQVPL
ncbi:uroporphyrinogen decarboxylase [Batrachochytrium salamandrivorans]|nr:uroporphyrinogen decarboxylase [Batrachochytrium salamandrivorans]